MPAAPTSATTPACSTSEPRKAGPTPPAAYPGRKENSESQKPDFDLDVAHKHFSVECFNKAWELLDKPECLEVSQGEDVAPFYLGYAYEAMARAELVMGNEEGKEKYLAEAQRVAEMITDPEEKKWLETEVANVRASDS